MVWDRTNRPVWLRYTVGVLVAVIAAAIRLQFLEILEVRAMFLTFYPAVAVAALYGGFGPGLLATVVSAALAKYYWIEPVGQFRIEHLADLISMVVFLPSCTLIAYLAEASHRAQARAFKAEELSRLAAEREKAAVELQQSESKYRELVQNANSAIVRWKRDGSIVFFNEYAQKFFGYSAEEVIGKKVNILVPDRETTGGDLTELVQDIVDHPERYENYINENILRDGSRVWMAWTNRPIFDQNGQVLEILAVGSDITGRRQAEEDVRRQREWLRVTLTSIGDAVIATDASGLITFINPVAAALTGWQPEEAVGIPVQKVFRIINEKTHEPASDIAEQVLREKCIVALANHTVLVSRDGREIPIEDSAAPIRDFAGTISGVVLVFHDVTDRRRAQETLRRSESRFKLLSETSSRLLESKNPRILVKELCREVMGHLDCHVFFNFLVDETIGKLHLNACAGIPAEEAERIEWLDYGVAVCGCVAREGERIVAEDIFNTPDIRTELVKSYGIQAYSCQPLMIQSKLIGTLSFGTKAKTHFSPEDLALMKTVTDQVATALEKVKLLDELKHSHDELELRVQERTSDLLRANETLMEQAALLDLAHDAIMVRDMEDRISYWSKGAEKTYGWTRDEALGKRSQDLLSTHFPKPWEEIKTELLLSGYWEGELRHRTQNRQSIVTDSRWAVQKDRHGNPSGFFEINRDITERKQMEEAVKAYMKKLEQTNQALQDFTSIASHDLHEPLRKLTAFGNMLQQKYGEQLGEGGKDYLDRMLNATSRMRSLLTALLEYSRVTTKAELLREVDLDGIVREVLSDLEIRIAETGGDVQVNNLPVVEADPTQMRQLFQNLIGNALKFNRAEEKPIIKVAGRRTPGDDGYLEICVEDNGVGFEEKYLDRIFAPFQRLHGRSSQFEGTGMGLAICKKIVERHGGSITAISEPGKGSTFIISLPQQDPTTVQRG